MSPSLVSFLLICVSWITHISSSFILVPAVDISWWQAQSECISRYGTSLATINTEEQYQNAQSLILSSSATLQLNAVYIGLNDHNVNGEWGWIDGTKCSLTHSALCTQFWLNPSEIFGHCGVLLSDNDKYGISLIAMDCVDIASDGYLCNVNACNMPIGIIDSDNSSSTIQCISNNDCQTSELCHFRLDDGTLHRLDDNEECDQYCTCYCIDVPTMEPTTHPTPEPTPTCFPTIEPTPFPTKEPTNDPTMGPTQDLIETTEEKMITDSPSKSESDSESESESIEIESVSSDSLDGIILNNKLDETSSDILDIQNINDDEDKNENEIDRNKDKISNIFDESAESNQDEISSEELKILMIDSWIFVLLLLTINISVLCICYFKKMNENQAKMSNADDVLSDFTNDIDICYFKK